MTVRKSILLTLALPLLFTLIFTIWAGVENAIVYLLGGTGLWIIGLVLGVFLSAVVRNAKKEPWLYISAQVIIFVLVFITIVVNSMLDARKEKATRNIRDNHFMVDLDNENPVLATQDREYIRTAFKLLESTFDNPNSFRLRSFFTRTRDTTLSARTETIYSVYFDYTTEDNDHLFSKISVLENKAHIDILDCDINANEEYRSLKAEQNQQTQKELKSAMDVIRELPDSTKKQIRDAIKPD